MQIHWLPKKKNKNSNRINTCQCICWCCKINHTFYSFVSFVCLFIIICIVFARFCKCILNYKISMRMFVYFWNVNEVFVLYILEQYLCIYFEWCKHRLIVRCFFSHCTYSLDNLWFIFKYFDGHWLIKIKYLIFNWWWIINVCV